MPSTGARSVKYTGPTINASDLWDGSDFHDEQAYLDAAYIVVHSDVTNLVLGVQGAYTADQKAVISGASDSGTFGAKFGNPFNIDFVANPPSQDVVDAVTAATQFNAQLKQVNQNERNITKPPVGKNPKANAKK